MILYCIFSIFEFGHIAGLKINIFFKLANTLILLQRTIVKKKIWMKICIIKCYASKMVKTIFDLVKEKQKLKFLFIFNLLQN